jgi:hypothetical protein
MSDDYRKGREDKKNEIRYIQDLLIKGGCCVICGFNRDPKIIELHHIAGWKNSDIVIPVCPNCHRSLSMGQEPRKIERGKDEKSEFERMGWRMDGYSLLLKLISYDFKEDSEILLGEE